MAQTPRERRRDQHERPNHAQEPLRERMIGEGTEEQKNARQGRIEEARPMQFVRQRHPLLRKIEPALPREPVAHLHEPHGVVGVDQGAGGIVPMRDQEPGDNRRQREREIRRERKGLRAGGSPEPCFAHAQRLEPTRLHFT